MSMNCDIDPSKQMSHRSSRFRQFLCEVAPLWAVTRAAHKARYKKDAKAIRDIHVSNHSLLATRV